MTCPVCAASLSGTTCAVCGYDRSRDYAKYPTFGPVKKAVSVSGMRSRRAPKDALCCEKCGGTAFTITIPEGIRLCQNCGWSPKPAPRLACACGSRYFSVRMSDGALECPLCGGTIPLAQLNAWFPPKLPEKTVPAPAVSAPPASREVKPVVTIPPVRIPTPPKKLKITAIAAGGQHTVALREDGTVRAVGSNKYGQCNVNKWKDIVSICAGYRYTAGKRSDGTWFVTGENPDRARIQHSSAQVTAVSNGPDHTLVLYNTGDIRGLTLNSSSNSDGQLNVKGWRSIIAIAAGNRHSVGLKADGTVVSAGSNLAGQRDLTKWQGITAIAAGHMHTVGLKKDGTVVYAGNYGDSGYSSKLFEVSRWRNITAIAAGSFHTVGLKSDGTLVACGTDINGACKVEELCAE